MLILQIAELYMALAGLPSETGLGYLDTTKSVLELEMELSGGPEAAPTDLPSSQSTRRSRQVSKKSGSVTLERVKSIPVTIHQDLGMLKGRKGDTGESPAMLV